MEATRNLAVIFNYITLSAKRAEITNGLLFNILKIFYTFNHSNEQFIN